MNTHKFAIAHLLAAAIVSTPSPSTAQVSRIQPGSEVEVRFRPGFQPSSGVIAGGTVLVAGIGGLTISTKEDDALLELQMEDLVYVRVRETRRHLAYKTSRIGAIAGAAIGLLGGTFFAGDGLILGGPGGNLVAGATGALIGAVGGFGIGMGLGAAFNRERWTTAEIPRVVASASIPLPSWP